MKTHVAARRSGEKARIWTQIGVAGRVLAVVTRCVYLETADGEIYWLIPPDIPMHRRAIQVSQLPVAKPGMAVVACGDDLLVGDTCIGLSTADRWLPRQPSTRQNGDLSGGAVAGCLIEPPRGLAALLFAPSLVGAHDPTQRALDNHAAPLIRAVRDGCGQLDVTAVLTAGQELIGLGAGLTPSGDDFLGAALFALYHTGCWDADPVDAFLKQARARTNAISFTMMADMAQGHGAEPLHDLLFAILSCAPRDIVEAAVTSLVHIGHTSGWDMLAGLLTGIHGYNPPASCRELNASEAVLRH